jgi:uncharacterized protein (TIGR00375 family)
MCPEGLWRWAQLKGIGVIGTGDFTHPEYFAELTEKLEPAEQGLYTLRESHREGEVPPSCRAEVRFMLQAEISSIYKKNGRTRKVHSIMLMPGLDEAAELNRRLGAIGNIKSDGRPILGLDAMELLRMVLDVSAEGMVIPAHAWTPHFSVFGSVSGFDSLEECYEDLTPHIYAIETGLSSDPPMNRMLSKLDGIRLVSNSDAHSPAKLGREATVFDCDRTYAGMARAMKTGEGLTGTVEFFPEEGKYHYDGHRNCGVVMHPDESRKRGGICPECGKKMTLGVMYRVRELADRDEPRQESYRSIVPLADIIAAVMGRGVNTKGVREAYFRLLDQVGPEFHVLLDAEPAAIERASSVGIADAIKKMRRGEVELSPGYDGVFGTVRVGA